MALIQSLVSSDKYSIKCPYAMSPVGICVHNTYNDAPAKNEISYMKSNGNQVSFHVAVDDVEAIQGIPFDRNAWAAGDGGSGTGNRKYIHFEICYSKSGGAKFVEAEKRAAKEIAALLKKFGWGISAVKKHQDFSGKYCPHRTLDQGWQRFLNMITAELNGTSVPTPPTSTPSTGTAVGYTVKITADVLNIRSGAGTNYPVVGSVKKGEVYTIVQESNGWGKLKSGAGWISLSYTSKSGSTSSTKPPAPAPAPQPSCDTEEKRYAENGKATITTSSGIKFRNKPCTCHGVQQGVYNCRESVNYDLVVLTKKYVWISWTSAKTGERRYMPVKVRATGERWANCQ